MNKTLQLIALTMLLGACNRALPCDDCEEVEAEEEADSDPPPDLPCGGADLQTDDQNCGECGNECAVILADTEWEAGGCQAGVCGPTWIGCINGPETCEEFCTSGGTQCVEGGCAGVSGLRVMVPGIDGCNLETNGKDPIESCNTIIDYQSDDPSIAIDVVCCCALPDP